MNIFAIGHFPATCRIQCYKITIELVTKDNIC